MFTCQSVAGQVIISAKLLIKYTNVFLDRYRDTWVYPHGFTNSCEGWWVLFNRLQRFRFRHHVTSAVAVDEINLKFTLEFWIFPQQTWELPRAFDVKCLRTLLSSTYLPSFYSEHKFPICPIPFDVVNLWAIIIRWCCYLPMDYSIKYNYIPIWCCIALTNQFLSPLSLDPILGCARHQHRLVVVYCCTTYLMDTRRSRTPSQYLGHWRRAVDIAAAAYQPRPMIPTVQVGCGGRAFCLPNSFNGCIHRCTLIGGWFCFIVAKDICHQINVLSIASAPPSSVKLSLQPQYCLWWHRREVASDVAYL